MISFQRQHYAVTRTVVIKATPLNMYSQGFDLRRCPHALLEITKLFLTTTCDNKGGWSDAENIIIYLNLPYCWVICVPLYRRLFIHKLINQKTIQVPIF